MGKNVTNLLYCTAGKHSSIDAGFMDDFAIAGRLSILLSCQSIILSVG
ncbi:hypothetical protein [Lysinibacillus parviboronicapiens]|nr:hypothetical protein [Lysinibacillus parviboronicapiens]